MITDDTRGSDGDWVTGVQQALEPFLHRIRYGNLRFEHSKWGSEHGTLENLAIVYEVPGGSTNQLNISYHEETRMFSFLPLHSHEEFHTESLADVVRLVEEAVECIPDIREQSLIGDIDRLVSQGKTSRDLFQHINALLKIEDLVGGAITMQEMKASIAYILARNQQ